MLRQFMMGLLVLSVAGSDSLAENNSGSFLRKGKKINLIGPKESLVQSLPLDGKCLQDWRFEAAEKEGAVIAVDSPRFQDGQHSGFFSPHRVFGDFEVDFEVDARTQHNLRFVFGMNRAGRGVSGVRFTSDDFGHVRFVSGRRDVSEFTPTAAELKLASEHSNKDWNRIRIRYEGTTFTVTLNDTPIVSHRVPTGKTGALGVLASGNARMKSRITVTSLTDPKQFPEVPIQGAGTQDRHPGMKLVDFGMLQEMDRVGAYCASVTRIENISAKRWRHDFTRTYGWLDGGRTKPAPIDAMICTATAARFPFACVWTDYLRAKGLNRNVPLFKVCNALPDVERFGPVADERIGQITVHQMLTERSGWTGDPVRQSRRLAAAKGLKLTTPQESLQALWTQPLQANPGSEASARHTWFHGWCEITGVEAMTGRPVIDVMKQYSLKPLGLDAVQITPNSRVDDEFEPRIVHNARGPLTSSASSFTLATLMATHFGDGRIRNTKGAGIVCSYGLLPQSTCMLVWADNVNWAIVLNRGAPNPSAVHDRFFSHYKRGFGKRAITGCFLYRQMNEQIAAQFEARKKGKR